MTHLGMRRRIVGIAFTLALVLSGCFVGTTMASTQYCPSVRDKNPFAYYELQSQYRQSHGNYMVDIFGRYQLVVYMFPWGYVPVSGAITDFYCTTIYA